MTLHVCCLAPGAIVLSTPCLLKDMKQKSFLQHCITACKVKAMWPQFKFPVASRKSAFHGNFIDDLCDLFPQGIYDVAHYLMTIPTFFEEVDIICPILDSFAHSATPNCVVKVQIRKADKQPLVVVQTIRAVNHGDVLTLLHAPQDLLLGFHCVGVLNNVPKDTCSTMDLVNVFAPSSIRVEVDMIVPIASILTHARNIHGNLPNISTAEVVMWLIGGRHNVIITHRNTILFSNEILSLKCRMKLRHIKVSIPIEKFLQKLRSLYALLKVSSSRARNVICKYAPKKLAV
jgi:hypothetical protein